MFIQRDARKVVEILESPADTVALKLGRREAEFLGKSGLLTDPKNSSKVRGVKQCSLYDNKLTKLEHWSTLGDNAKELEDLNVRAETASEVNF
jgi:hypothetical protein